MPEKTNKDMVEFTEAEKHLQTYASLVILEVFHKCDSYKEEEVEVMLRHKASAKPDHEQTPEGHCSPHWVQQNG